MTILKLRYFMEVVKCGSISEAAKSLFITQPSLSTAIKELEDELGFGLFIRTNKGVVLSNDGTEFMGYASQILEQVDLMEERYLDDQMPRHQFALSTQHYAFVVQAFVNFVKRVGGSEYEYLFRDTRTYEILEDVRTLRSEIGVIFINDFNEKVMTSLFKKYDLEFTELFSAKPHIFVSSTNPLVNKEFVTLSDLEEYPHLSYEQGEHNAFYFSEEILSTLVRKQSIQVSDRATIFNLMIGLNGYTISSGRINADLNGNDIVSIPLQVQESIRVGYIKHKRIPLSKMGSIFIEELVLATRD